MHRTSPFAAEQRAGSDANGYREGEREYSITTCGCDPFEITDRRPIEITERRSLDAICKKPEEQVFWKVGWSFASGECLPPGLQSPKIEIAQARDLGVE